MEKELPKEAFIALAALSWADGSVRPKEKTGLLTAAKSCGLEEDEVAEVDAALSTEGTLDSFVPGDMTEWQRVLTYALAVWLVRADGVQSTSESGALGDLAKRLDIDKGTTDRAASAANDISCLPTGRPERFDFVILSKRLAEKLPQLAKR